MAIYKLRAKESEERDLEKLKNFWRYKCCNNYKKVTGSAGNPSEDFVSPCILIHEGISLQGNSVALGLADPDEDDYDSDYDDEDVGNDDDDVDNDDGKESDDNDGQLDENSHNNNEEVDFDTLPKTWQGPIAILAVLVPA